MNSKYNDDSDLSSIIYKYKKNSKKELGEKNTKLKKKSKKNIFDNDNDNLSDDSIKSSYKS
jgi:hypothetical protein